MVMGMLKMQNPDEITFQSINFNFYTTSAVLQVSFARGLRHDTQIELFDCKVGDLQVAEAILFGGDRVTIVHRMSHEPTDFAQT